MIRKLGRGHTDERGIAVITALLVSVVAVILGITSVAVAIHNSEASSFDRRRVQGVAASEAGLNWYYSHLQSVPAAQFQCSASQTLTSTPATQFSATVTFYSATGAALACPPTASTPAAALIRSVGTSSAAEPRRTMESYVNLIPIVGGPFANYAVFSDQPPEFNSNVQVFGDGTTNGNIYSNGNILMDSNAVIDGSVFAQGWVQMDSNAEVKADVYANQFVKMNSNSRILGNVRSSVSSVTLDSNAHVFGNARAGTTITTLGSSIIDGSRTPNAPSPPPPSQPFPSYTFNAADWTAEGYSVQTFTDCSSAKSFIDGIAGGDWVVRITAGCDLRWSSNSAVNVTGNLAIVSDGALTMDSNSKFQNVGSPHTLHLIFGLARTSPCNITFKSNTSISDGITTLLYTPCVIDMTSNSFIVEGQIFGGAVNFNSNSNLTFAPINVPGVSSGLFDEDIVYIREVIG
jgi:cytoskeletal protein CcmA (bactofilin family)/Tfp pilus assembly protein PilX